MNGQPILSAIYLVLTGSPFTPAFLAAEMAVYNQLIAVFFPLFALALIKSGVMKPLNMYELEQEKTLICKAQAGDRNAFEGLYKAFFPGLYAYVHSRMPTTVEAEDLVSDVVLRLIQRLHDFNW